MGALSNDSDFTVIFYLDHYMIYKSYNKRMIGKADNWNDPNVLYSERQLPEVVGSMFVKEVIAQIRYKRLGYIYIFLYLNC